MIKLNTYIVVNIEDISTASDSLSTSIELAGATKCPEGTHIGHWRRIQSTDCGSARLMLGDWLDEEWYPVRVNLD